jgi:O-succinylbenzoic acid--CoA ligase
VSPARFEDALRVRARATPDATYIASEHGAATFGAVDAVAEVLADRLHAAVPTGPVATILSVGPAMAAVTFAAGRAGFALAPLHRRRAPADLIAAVEALDPGAILHDPGTADVARAIAGDRPVLDVARLAGGSPPPPPAGPAAPSASDPEIQRALDTAHEAARLAGVPPPGTRIREGALGATDDAFLLWTSGTDGTSRAVRVSHANLMAVAGGSALRLDLAADDSWLAVLDPAHIGGLALLVRAAVVGFRLVTRERFDATEVASLLDAGAITSASLVPTMLRRLLEARGERLAPAHARCLLVGGDGVPRALLERALDLRYPLALTYGLTEASSQVCTAPPALVREKPGTVGWPLKGVEIHVREATGEILVRGDTIAAGYLGGDAALVGGDGWLATGDVGHVDGDGHLWVMGRLSDRIITGGVNVDPAEVSARLSMDPAVEEVVVVGLPDEEWGEVVAAAFVPRAADPDIGALTQRWHASLSGPMKPREVVAVEAIPRNANGKVDRDAVRALFGARTSSRLRASGAR